MSIHTTVYQYSILWFIFFFLHIKYVFTFWFWVHLSTISSHYLLTNNIELENDTTYRINVNGAKKQFILILFHLWMLTFTVHAAIVQSDRLPCMQKVGCSYHSHNRSMSLKTCNGNNTHACTNTAYFEIALLYSIFYL